MLSFCQEEYSAVTSWASCLLPNLYAVSTHCYVLPLRSLCSNIRVCFLTCAGCRSSRREGERSGKRKRHHAEHAEQEVLLREPATAVLVSNAVTAPVSDARVTLEASEEVASLSKRARHVPVQVNILLSHSCTQVLGRLSC